MPDVLLIAFIESLVHLLVGGASTYAGGVVIRKWNKRKTPDQPRIIVEKGG